MAWVACAGVASLGRGSAEAQETGVMMDRARDAVEAALAPYRVAGSPGLAAAVLIDGQLAVAEAAGLASLEFRAPLSTATPMYIGSVSKQFLAMLALTLHARGELDLDAPVTRFLPELPLVYRTVPVRNLLYHASGIRDFLQLRHHAGADLAEVLSPSAVTALLARQSRLDFPAGTDVSYSNSNYFLLTEVLQAVTEETVSALADRFLFEPIKMSTSTFLIDGQEVVEDRARGYTREGEHYRVHEPTWGLPGLLTSLDDLVLWARALRRRLAEHDPVVAAMTTAARLPGGAVTHEGAGLRLDTRFGRRVFEHNGSNRGFNAHLSWYPDEDVFVIVLSNVRQAGATNVAHSLAAHIYGVDAAARRSFPELPAEVTEELTRFIGSYESTSDSTALEFEVDAPYAIVTLYGGHPSESRTASNVLQPTAEPNVFDLFGVSPRVRVRFGIEPEPEDLIVEFADGEVQRYTRARSLPNTSLQDVAGRYRSDDLNVFYLLRVSGDHLEIHIERPDGVVVDRGRLTRITPDLFTLERDPVTNFRLSRDSEGNVLGFELFEPRLRAVRFPRVSPDRTIDATQWFGK